MVYWYCIHKNEHIKKQKPVSTSIRYLHAIIIRRTRYYHSNSHYTNYRQLATPSWYTALSSFRSFHNISIATQRLLIVILLVTTRLAVLVFLSDLNLPLFCYCSLVETWSLVALFIPFLFFCFLLLYRS